MSITTQTVDQPGGGGVQPGASQDVTPPERVHDLIARVEARAAELLAACSPQAGDSLHAAALLLKECGPVMAELAGDRERLEWIGREWEWRLGWGSAHHVACNVHGGDPLRAAIDAERANPTRGPLEIEMELDFNAPPAGDGADEPGEPDDEA